MKNTTNAMACSSCSRVPILRIDEQTVLCSECFEGLTNRLKAELNSISDGAPFSSLPQAEMEPAVTLVLAPSGSFPEMPKFLVRKREGASL